MLISLNSTNLFLTFPNEFRENNHENSKNEAAASRIFIR